MRLKRPSAGWAGKVLFGAVYAVAAAEVFLRLLAPQLMLPRYVCATDYGVRGNVPNGDYWHKAPEYRINIRTNSKGIRADREIPYEKPPGVRRIMLLGDSFGMGYGVNLEDAFLTRLVAFLQAAGVQCEDVNLSVSGFGTAEELVTLEEEGFRYQPDVVVVQWQRTDLEDNVRSNLYGLEDGRLVRKNKTYLPAVKSRELVSSFGAVRWLAIHSHLYCCLREEAAQFAKFKFLPAWRRLTNVRPKAGPRSAVGQPDGYPERLALALLAEMQQQCRWHGAELLILDIPSRLSRTEFRSTFPTEHLSDGMQFHRYNPIADFGQYYGQKLYWEKEHGHFTPLGCRIVGEGLGRTILENGLLEREKPSSADSGMPAHQAAGCER